MDRGVRDPQRGQSWCRKCSRGVAAAPVVGPPPLEVEVGGVEAWVGMPLGCPTPLEVEVEVGGVGAWVGMEVGVVGVCGPTDTPLTLLTVLSVEPPPPPPLVCYGSVGIRVPPPCVRNFTRDPPIWGMVCVGCGPNFFRGYPLGGESWGCEGILGDSWRLGARPVGG